MSTVTLRYWAAAKHAAGVAEETISAETLAAALEGALSARERKAARRGHRPAGRARQVLVPSQRHPGRWACARDRGPAGGGGGGSAAPVRRGMSAAGPVRAGPRAGWTIGAGWAIGKTWPIVNRLAGRAVT